MPVQPFDPDAPKHHGLSLAERRSTHGSICTSLGIPGAVLLGCVYSEGGAQCRSFLNAVVA